jgi:hypothetical protein
MGSVSIMGSTAILRVLAAGFGAQAETRMVKTNSMTSSFRNMEGKFLSKRLAGDDYDGVLSYYPVKIIHLFEPILTGLL